jgi:hypothetical protein
VDPESKVAAAEAGSRPDQLRRVALASAVGTTIEWYDYFIYSTAAALVFASQFFPRFDPATGTLASFATLGVGFLARPVAASSGVTSGTGWAARRCSSRRCC